MRKRERALLEELSIVHEMVSSINTALIVREPGTAVAADAFDGLRRQVAQATAERRAHLIELSRLLEALDKGVSGDQLERLVSGWADQAGLRQSWDSDQVEWFEIIGERKSADPLEVAQPAWVAGDPPVLVRPGVARRIESEALPLSAGRHAPVSDDDGESRFGTESEHDDEQPDHGDEVSR